MAITQIRGAQVLDLTIDTADLAASSVTEAKLNTSVAGAGLAGGGGTPLSVNVTDGLAISGDDVILAAAAAGAGLAYASGILSVNATGGLEVSGDDVQLAAAVAGAGIDLTTGVLSVNVDDSTIEIAADTLRVKALGITNGELALGSVDVDNLSDLRVTEGTALVADFAAGTVRADNGTTVTILSVSAGTTTVADDDESFVEVDNAGSVTNNITGFTQGQIPLARVTAAGGDITAIVDSRAWLDIDPGADTGIVDADIVENETPSGDLDGADVTYTLTADPSPASSLKLYLNGIRQRAGGEDFTLATNVITFVAAPVSTDVILADFRK